MKKKLGIIVPILLVLIVGAFAAVYFTMPKEPSPLPPVAEQPAETTPLSTDADTTAPEAEQPDTTEDTGTMDMDLAEFHVLCEKAYNAVWSNATVLNSDKDHESMELRYLEINVEAAGYTYNEAYKTAYISWKQQNNISESFDKIVFNEDATKITVGVILDCTKVYESPCVHHGKVWDLDMGSDDKSSPHNNQAVIGYRISEGGTIASFVHNGKTYYTPVSNIGANVAGTNMEYALGLYDVFSECGSLISTTIERSTLSFRTPDITNINNLDTALGKGDQVILKRINKKYGIALVDVAANTADTELRFISLSALDSEDVQRFTSESTLTTNTGSKKDEDDTTNNKPTGGSGSSGSGDKPNNNSNTGNTGNNNGNTGNNNNTGSNGNNDGRDLSDAIDLIGKGNPNIGGSDGTEGQTYPGIYING